MSRECRNAGGGYTPAHIYIYVYTLVCGLYTCVYVDVYIHRYILTYKMYMNTIYINKQHDETHVYKICIYIYEASTQVGDSSSCTCEPIGAKQVRIKLGMAAGVHVIAHTPKEPGLGGG